MAKLLKLRGGTTSQHSSFTGADREVTVDTDKETLVVHNGSTAGGFPVMRNVVEDATPQLGGDLDVNGNDIVSLSNGHINVIPHGTGNVTLQTDTVEIGSANENVTITSNGTGDLTINTNSGTNSGVIAIADGANGDIAITPNGSGKVVLDGLSYPTADGSANQFIKTNGSGALGFATVDLSGLSPIAGSSSIVTTGALNSGSITSGFGTINNGASAITTTGVGTFGSLDIEGAIDVNGTTNLDIVDIDGAVDIATTLAVAGNTTVGGTLGVTGVLTGTSLDISGNIDVDGTMEADAITLNGTAIGSIYSPIAGGTGILTTGALNSGSITSGFGTINNGASAITTTGTITGGAINGTSFASTGNMTFQDSDKATFGAGADLQIYHDGSNSYIQDTATGDLVLTSDGTGILLQKAVSETMGKFIIDGAVELYHNNAKKFDTTAAGISVTGTITASGDITAFSDRRLKTDITNIDDALSKVMQMQGVNYKRNDIEDAPQSIGVIAQDMEAILPEVIHTADDERQTKSVDYGKITSVLIEAIKELKLEIDKLKKEYS